MNPEYITPDWRAPQHVKVLSTTRRGGVSGAPYDSLNLGLHVGDDAAAVRENRRLVALHSQMPGEPHWLRQVHGDVIAIHGDLRRDALGQPSPGGRLDITADGAFTADRDEVLVVVTADCLPVVITDDSGNQLAVVHAGWRGLAAGILGNAIAQFRSAARLHAWLGPAIGPEVFEVGPEVRQAFSERNPNFDAAFTPHPAQAEKYFADLYALATMELQAHASVEISGGGFCTLTDKARFHSHRRDGAASGRMGTYAWLDKTGQ